MTPGLANKLSMTGARKICCNFPETLTSLPADKAVLTGTPIREELGMGSREEGKKLCGFTDDKPVLMVIGGSLGAQSVNETVRYALPRLLPDFNVVHICGKEKMDNLKLSVPGYKQFEYVKNELKDIFAMADIVVSRAGANSICELLALKKPNILIPLSTKASRGDQILNADSFKRQGYSYLLREEDMTNETLLEAVKTTWEKRDEYIEAMTKLAAKSAVTGRECMILSARDRERCGEALVAAANAKLSEQGRPANLTLSSEPGDMKAGFLLREGDVSVNCSVEVLAELCRSEMAAKVASALFD
jgi:UDP-N-acetylglucosamine--N-acetylmuramyl-(pentapeptide) pyrophosphoryl-undecaprenol N-acetylglucosamine transferase